MAAGSNYKANLAKEQQSVFFSHQELKMNRILVVDDDQDLRENIMEILKADGFEVWAAGNGEEALQALKETEFDLVLLDACPRG